MIHQVKRNFSELKVNLRDIERRMDTIDKDKLFTSDDDNIEVNARNYALIRQPPSGKRRKNGGV